MNSVLQAAAQDLYNAQANAQQQTGANAQQGGAQQSGNNNNGGDDQVTDVDFEEVK